VEVFAPDHIETTVDIYVDFDSSGQYTLWESGSGKGRILIDGETVHPERVRVDLSRYRAQSSSLIGSTPRNEYSFQVAEIVFMSSAYAEEGNVVTDPINLGNDQISSIIVDVDASSPATSSVNAYIARDVDGASSLSDFRWVQVDKNNDVSGLMTLSYEVQEIVATAPSKIRTGSGLYSNSIYSIGSVDGKIVRVDEGFNQFEVRKMSVNSNGSLPEADSLDWSRSDQSVVNSSGSSVSGANYYKLSTSIYADNESSHKIQLSLDGAESYKVKLNGTDLTTRIQDGENSASFQKGKNDLVIYLCTGEESGSVSVSIGDIAGCSMMISRPTIVQESSLNSSENRIAQSGKDLVVNHDPTGRIFRVHTERSSGTKIDTVRLRIELKRGLNGETPQVKRAFITTGV
jgi:hypothetical protein